MFNGPLLGLMSFHAFIPVLARVNYMAGPVGHRAWLMGTRMKVLVRIRAVAGW